MSCGPFLSAARQRAASTIRAVESGPPETASRSAGADLSPANSVLASVAETGAPCSAADTLLFPVDALLHAERRAGIFAQHLSERRAGRLLLAQHRERLTEPQQRVGRLGGGLIFGRDIEEGFGGVAIALPLEQAFAEPILGVGRHPVAGIFAQEGAKSVLRQRIVLAQDIAIGEVVIILRAVRRRQCRHLGSAGAEIAPLCGRRPAWRHAARTPRIRPDIAAH